MPAMAGHLLGLLAREHVGMAEVSATVAADPAVTAEVLRAANSAEFGLRGEVTDLRHATTLLGIDRLRALAGTVGLRRYLGTTLQTPAVTRVWRHSLACALIAEQLAVRCGGHAGDAYTAGLIHDLGRLALVVAHPGVYPTFLDATTATGRALLGAEHETFGMDHCAAGRWLAQQLRLPQGFQDVAQHHHDPPATERSELLARIAVSCRLADHLGYQVTLPVTMASAEPQALLDGLLEPLPQADRVAIVSELGPLAAEVAGRVEELVSMLAA
jgi:HD-like signal output (HDOD) protein